MNLDSDTIAGIATAPGAAAIAIVRISGPESLRIADELFKSQRGPPSTWPPATFGYGKIHDAKGLVLDEAILLIMRSPTSYTKEDVVEFQIHGGIVPARRVFQAITQAGARPAEPGEFTKRAFLNGRIDLIQAEAVMDFISATSERSASLALEQLAGDLSTKITSLYESLLSALADIEASLDFIEDELPENIGSDLVESLESIKQLAGNLLKNRHEGRILREGARVVISGKPNAGKSTLMNVLLGFDRAIISPQPGTTRDFIEETIIIAGYPVRLIDTAGLRESDCEVEQQGVAQTINWLKKADIQLHLFDMASENVFAELDSDFLKNANKDKLILVLNKTDLNNNPAIPGIISSYKTIYISALYRQGIEQLKQAILEKLDLTILETAGSSLLSERHADLLSQAQEHINDAILILQTEDSFGYVPAALMLRKAAEFLGRIVGRVYDNDLLDKIFSRFCIGK